MIQNESKAPVSNVEIKKQVDALELIDGGGYAIGHAQSDQLLIGNQSDFVDLSKNVLKFCNKVSNGTLRVTSYQDRKNGTRARIKGKDYGLAQSVSWVKPDLIKNICVEAEVVIVAEANSEENASNLFCFRPNEIVNDKKIFEHLIDWERNVKRKLNSRRFKKLKSNINTTKKRRINSFKKAVNEAFEVRSQLVFCRVDFFIDITSRDNITLYEFEQYYERFFNSLRRNKLLYDGLLCAINKFEYGGRGKGYHFHSLFLYDARKVYRDDRKSFALGQHWASVATRGKGNYFTSNASKRKRFLSKYINFPVSELALGRVRRGDAKSYLHIQALAVYFAKFSQSVRPERRSRFKALRVIRTPYLKKLQENMRKRRS